MGNGLATLIVDAKIDGGNAMHPEIHLPQAEALAKIEAYIESGDWMKFQKHAKYQTHTRRQSKPYP